METHHEEWLMMEMITLLCNLPFSVDLELRFVVVFNNINKSVVPKPFFLVLEGLVVTAG